MNSNTSGRKSMKYVAAILMTTCALSIRSHAQVVPTAPTTLPDPLSLDQAIDIALGHQPQQFIAATQRTAASGAVTQAQSKYFPSITPTYDYEIDSSAQFNKGSGHTNT